MAKTPGKNPKNAAQQAAAKSISAVQVVQLSAAVQKEIASHIEKIRQIMTNENLEAIFLSDGETLKNP